MKSPSRAKWAISARRNSRPRGSLLLLWRTRQPGAVTNAARADAPRRRGGLAAHRAGRMTRPRSPNRRRDQLQAGEHPSRQARDGGIQFEDCWHTRKMGVHAAGLLERQEVSVLYLLHGIGGDETEWQRFATPDVLLDNLIADGKAVPMIIVMPNGRAQKNDRADAGMGRRRRSRPLNATYWMT